MKIVLSKKMVCELKTEHVNMIIENNRIIFYDMLSNKKILSFKFNKSDYSEYIKIDDDDGNYKFIYNSSLYIKSRFMLFYNHETGYMQYNMYTREQYKKDDYKSFNFDSTLYSQFYESFDAYTFGYLRNILTDDTVNTFYNIMRTFNIEIRTCDSKITVLSTYDIITKILSKYYNFGIIALESMK